MGVYPKGSLRLRMNKQRKRLERIPSRHVGVIYPGEWK